MNLIWLKYVSYAGCGGAVLVYILIRVNRLSSISREARLLLYAACVIVACLGRHVQESNAEQHSPRQLVIGTVVSVSTGTHRSGAIEDTFQLKTSGGALSPKFSTDIVAHSAAEQPIHTGDMLGVLYRAWDRVAVSIDELEGQRTGWRYTRHRALDPFVWTVAIVGAIGFLGVLVSTFARRNTTPRRQNSIHLS